MNRYDTARQKTTNSKLLLATFQRRFADFEVLTKNSGGS
jgi:hypothetical protein